jgi:hypothetical protein
VNPEVAKALTERVALSSSKLSSWAEDYGMEIATSIRSKSNAIDMRLNIADDKTKNTINAAVKVSQNRMYAAMSEPDKVLL